MMDVQELNEVPQLKGLSREELKQLAKIVHKRCYSKGEVIFAQQQTANHFYLVTQGEAKLEKVVPQEPQHLSSTLEAGAYFGNLSLLPGVKYYNTAQALADCELFIFDGTGFNELAAENPGCGLKIIKDITVCLCHRLRKMDERYIDMVDYMIDGELYGSRYQTPTNKVGTHKVGTHKVGSPEGTPATAQAKHLARVTEQELEGIPLFAKLTAGEKKKVALIMAGCHYQGGEYIFDEDTGERKLYIIRDGIVKITKMVQQNKAVTLAMLREGKFFGVLSLLEEKGHSAGAQAIRDTQVLVMDKPAFEELLQQEPCCGLKIMSHICQDVVNLLSKIEQDFDYTSKYVWETGPFYL